jgi:hypothetical protein
MSLFDYRPIEVWPLYENDDLIFEPMYSSRVPSNVFCRLSLVIMSS